MRGILCGRGALSTRHEAAFPALQDKEIRKIAVWWKTRSAMHRCSEHVDARARTLAPESRHIVAFGLSGTTSRAAVLIPRVHFVQRTRSGAIFAPGEG